jgi:hypothetical protein
VFFGVSFLIPYRKARDKISWIFVEGKKREGVQKSTPKQKRKAPRQKKKKKRRKDKEATRELNFDGRRDTLHNKIQYIWLDIYKNKFLYIKSPKYMYMQLEREESGVPKKKRKRRRKETREGERERGKKKQKTRVMMRLRFFPLFPLDILLQKSKEIYSNKEGFLSGSLCV